MLWKCRDMGSDQIFVLTDIPVNNGKVQVEIPYKAYQCLVDWCSMGRTMDNVCNCLSEGSPDTHMAYQEMEELREALCEIHGAIRQHYITLPGKSIVPK